MCLDPYNVTPIVTSSMTSNAWVEVTVSITATGGEEYLVIGNFADNANTNIQANGAPLMGSEHGAYTFIDDVSVEASCTPTASSITETACFEYTSPSQNYTYTQSGTYNDTIPNAEGCDSVITIDLTINTVDTSVNQNGVQLTSNASNATFQWLDCDDNYAALTGETDSFFVASSNGNYAVEVTQNNCVDTSLCYQINSVSINELDNESLIQIYPNPSKGKFNVLIPNFDSQTKINIIDIAGKIMHQYTPTANLSVLDLDIPKGLYIVEIRNKAGSELFKILIK